MERSVNTEKDFWNNLTQEGSILADASGMAVGVPRLNYLTALLSRAAIAVKRGEKLQVTPLLSAALWVALELTSHPSAIAVPQLKELEASLQVLYHMLS